MHLVKTVILTQPEVGAELDPRHWETGFRLQMRTEPWGWWQGFPPAGPGPEFRLCPGTQHC